VPLGQCAAPQARGILPHGPRLLPVGLLPGLAVGSGRRPLALGEQCWGRRCCWRRSAPAAAGGGRPRLLLFRRAKDGRLWADDFLDEADVCAEAVAVLDPAMIRLERERLYLTVANGVAVYVPVGPSPLPHCTRYGRLYLRRAVGEGR